MRYTLMVVLAVTALLGSSYASAADDICDVPVGGPRGADAGIKQACYAYDNPPAEVKGLIMDDKSFCYHIGKSVYDEVYQMSKPKPDALFAAYDAAAEELLRRTYYNCDKGVPILPGAKMLLKELANT